MSPRNEKALEFAPAMLAIERAPPSPLPHAVLYGLTVLFFLMLAWAFVGRLDIVAVAQGKIVPQSFLKILQPAEPGIVRDILVTDGDAVQKDQVLIRMDTQLSDADRRTVENELMARNLQLRRVDAELSGSALKQQPDDPPGWFAQVEAQHRARRQSHLDALDAEKALLARARQDLGAALEIEEKLKKTVPIFRQQAEGWDQLAREGFAGKLMAMERQRLFIENEHDLRAQHHNIAGVRATIAQAEMRIAQIVSSYRQHLHNERVEAEAQRHRLREELDKHRYRSGLLELRAPQSGVVKDLATRTPGTVVAPGTILLTLVPQDEPLIAEVWVRNLDSGFVRRNQSARVKLAAYPFQKYGMVNGRVQQVNPDAQDKPHDPSGDGRMQEAAYRTLIRLDEDHLESSGVRFPLVAGMLVSAEIHLGTRTVIEYLLSPVRKVIQEAGRER